MSDRSGDRVGHEAQVRRNPRSGHPEGRAVHAALMGTVPLAICAAVIGAATAAVAGEPTSDSGTITVNVPSAISLTVVDTAQGPVYEAVTNSRTSCAVSVDASAGVLTITAGIR